MRRRDRSQRRATAPTQYRALGAPVLAALLALGGLVPPAGATAPARSKPGPVTIRGVAVHVRASTFTLQTVSAGTYAVVLRPATGINTVHSTSPAHVKEGEHVGVRGFLRGRTLTAIHVTIYPAKSRPTTTTLQATIVAVHLPAITIDAGGKRVQVEVTSSTDIRIGSASGSSRQLHAGQRILVRLESQDRVWVALSVHVYASQVRGTHVVLHGSVVSVGGAGIVVTSGSQRYDIGINAKTAVHVGRTLGAMRSLHAGQTVTVYACCEHGPLVATSIHIDKTASSTSATSTIRGTVVAIHGNTVQLKVSSGPSTIVLAKSTVVELGSTPLKAGGIQVGDDVSVRGTRSGNLIVASRVHIYVASRAVHRVEGTIVSLSRTALVVRSTTGARITVLLPRGTPITLSAKPAAVTLLRAGDTVRAYGRYVEPTTLIAQRVLASRPASASPRSIRGVITALPGAAILVSTSAGARYRVVLGRGVRVLWNGKAAPPIAIFVGERVDAKGTLSGTVLTATSVTVTVTPRAASGRLLQVNRATLTVKGTRGTTLRVQMVKGTVIRDGSHRLDTAMLHPGSFVKAVGFEAGTNVIRAETVRVEHPVLSIIGTLTLKSGGGTVATSDGQIYLIRFDGQSQISSERTHIPLQPVDVPNGAYVHVTGKVNANAELVVADMTVRLASVTLRGHVVSLGQQSVSVQAGTVTSAVRLLDTASVLQGTHTMTLPDVVVGDDVTVYGYRTAGGVLARELLIHRARITLTGTISQITATGFSMAVAGTSYTVVVTADTALSGSVPVLGSAVHVRGYRRGDGTILAASVQVSGP